MTDFYQFFTGRPSPGRRAPSRQFRYINGARDEAVERASRASEAARQPASEAPRWAQAANAERAREVANRLADNPDHPVGPGGVVIPDVPAERVPFSALSGADTRPFGDDFGEWYRSSLPQRGRISPIVREQEGPAIYEPTNEGRAGAGPIGVEGGTVNVPTRMERGANDRAPTVATRFDPVEQGWDDERQAGAVPMPDPTRDWAAAEQRAQTRWREGRPTMGDVFMAIVWGTRAGPFVDPSSAVVTGAVDLARREQARREQEELEADSAALREQVREGRF